ncbi:MAG: hypothetical protein IKK15_00680 [Akkermansia sp.]|nr:hypothetical protein [Akkermansia sp.]
MKQYVKRWAALAVLALGVMSAQANAASVAVNLSGAGVQVVVKDNCKHAKKHHKVVKKHGHKMDRRKAMARHRVDRCRFDDRGRKFGKGKR